VTFNNRSPPERQLSDFKGLTGGSAHVRLVFDATVIPQDTPLRVFHQSLSGVKNGDKDAESKGSGSNPNNGVRSASIGSLSAAKGYEPAESKPPTLISPARNAASMGSTTYFSAVDME
jgi:hypothetical protein